MLKRFERLPFNRTMVHCNPAYQGEKVFISRKQGSLSSAHRPVDFD